MTPTLTLAVYAEAVARLARPFSEREVVLADLGIDGAAFELAARAWPAVLKRDPEARAEFRRLFKRANDAQAPAEPSLPDATMLGARPALGPVMPFVDGEFRPAAHPLAPAERREGGDETVPLGALPAALAARKGGS